MKTLFILRHGKSAWNDWALPDHRRPLKPKGERRTHEVAEQLLACCEAGEFERPERIVASSAVRAVETARIVAKTLDLKKSQLVLEDRLYETSRRDYLEVVREQDDALDSLMLVGHNYQISDFVHSLLSVPIGILATSGCVVLRFPVASWDEIGTTPAELLFKAHVDG